MPPPYAGPLIAAMIGCGMRRMAGTTSLMYDIDRIASRENPRSWVFGGMPRSCRSRPEQNAAARARQHDDPRVVVIADFVERCVQRLDQWERHRVQPFGLVERDDAHVRTDVAIDQYERHGAHRSDGY